MEAWKSSEVRIMGMHYRLMFDCKHSNMGIRDQLHAAAYSVENVLQKGKMVRTWIKRSDVGVLKPTFHLLQGFYRPHGGC